MIPFACTTGCQGRKRISRHVCGSGHKSAGDVRAALPVGGVLRGRIFLPELFHDLSGRHKGDCIRQYRARGFSGSGSDDPRGTVFPGARGRDLPDPFRGLSGEPPQNGILSRTSLCDRKNLHTRKSFEPTPKS